MSRLSVDVREILARLEAHFGPRYWWPAVGVPEPTPAEPFEMIVGAILVQNVSWSNTEKALLALKAAGLLTPEAMHAAPEEALYELIRPTGYFRQKAKKLKGFLAHLYVRYDGDLNAMLARPLGELRTELLSLSGIGPETCDCILCYAAGYPVMPMDAYTRRIFSRMGVFEPAVTYDQMQAFFHQHLPADTAVMNEYHAQIDTLGHRVCLKQRPLCQECPLESLCPKRGVAEPA